MALGSPGRPEIRLNVLAMAGALVFAAFLGAALGLVWQSTGLGDEGQDAASASVAARDPA